MKFEIPNNKFISETYFQIGHLRALVAENNFLLYEVLRKMGVDTEEIERTADDIRAKTLNSHFEAIDKNLAAFLRSEINDLHE